MFRPNPTHAKYSKLPLSLLMRADQRMGQSTKHQQPKGRDAELLLSLFADYIPFPGELFSQLLPKILFYLFIFGTGWMSNPESFRGLCLLCSWPYCAESDDLLTSDAFCRHVVLQFFLHWRTSTRGILPMILEVPLIIFLSLFTHFAWDRISSVARFVQKRNGNGLNRLQTKHWPRCLPWSVCSKEVHLCGSSWRSLRGQHGEH